MRLRECFADRRKYDKMVEKERVFDFLHWLNLNLNEVRGRLLGIEAFLSIRDVFAEVRREQSKKKVMLIDSGHSNSEVYTPTSALNVSRGKIPIITIKGESQKEK